MTNPSYKQLLKSFLFSTSLAFCAWLIMHYYFGDFFDALFNYIGSDGGSHCGSKGVPQAIESTKLGLPVLFYITYWIWFSNYRLLVKWTTINLIILLVVVLMRIHQLKLILLANEYTPTTNWIEFYSVQEEMWVTMLVLVIVNLWVKKKHQHHS